MYYYMYVIHNASRLFTCIVYVLIDIILLYILHFVFIQLSCVLLYFSA